MKIKFKLKLTKKQQEAYDLIHKKEVKTLVCCYSRQCGKSVLAEILLLENMFKKNSFNAYISPSFSQGRKVYNEIIKLLEGKNIIKKSNGSTLTIETIYGSQLQFFSMESPTAIRGFTVSGLLVLDEAAFFPDQLTDGTDPYGNVILPITKARNPKVLMISTPAGKRGLFWDWYNKGLKDEDGVVSMTATIYDDELVSKEQIEVIKNSISPQAFQQEFEVKFLDSSLTYFTGFETCFTQYTYNNTLPQYIGIDLSSTIDGDNTVVTKINSNNETEQHIIKGSLQEKYQHIASIINSTNNLKSVYIESNGVGLPMIEEIKKLVKPQIHIQEWNTSNESKNEILSNLALTISKREIVFQKDNTKLFSEFGTFIYKYTKTGKLQLEAQSGHHDDMVLSLAIALRSKTDNTSLGGYTLNFHKKKNKIYTLAEKYG